MRAEAMRRGSSAHFNVYHSNQADDETLIGLVSRYSPTGQESTASHWLVERMKHLGYTHAYLDEVGNAIGIMGFGFKQVVLLGHIDTVPGEIPVRLEGNLLYGRGTVDAKGALAAFVDAVAQVAIKPQVGSLRDWQFIVIGAVDEEGDSKGARYAATQYHPDFVLIGEPNHWTRIGLGYKGSAWAEVVVQSQQRHSANGEPTACEQAVDLWLSIKNAIEALNAEIPRHFDRLLLTLGEISSGQDGFTQWARLKIGVRLPPAITPEQWYARLELLAKEAQVERVGYAVPAWVCEKNTPLVRAFLRAIRAHGKAPSFVFKSGTSDLNVVAPIWKCPALVYGPGDSHLDHTPFEHIDLEEYRSAVQVLTEALLFLSGA
jgi:LysW-gamma-L-lysine carboxypeptidase